MNDELQKQLATLLESLISTVQDSTTWAKGEVPLLVQEKITFGLIEAFFFLLLGMLLAFGAYKTFMHFKPKFDKGERWQRDGEGFGLIASGAVSCIAYVMITVSIRTILLAWFAPRLYIIEWLTSLVRSNQ